MNLHHPASVRRQHQSFPEQVGSKGHIITWTTMAHKKSPVALIETESGKRLMVAVCAEDCSVCAAGKKIKLVVRKLAKSSRGLIAYGLKAKILS